MCGIAGILSSNPGFISIGQLKRMTDSLAHRGPDGEGIWINENTTAGFGHRRLSIIDLSDAGTQPMHLIPTLSINGEGDAARYTIVHNGEIYNYIELREELKKKGYSFQSQTDTEVIVAAYDCWQEECVNYLDGMFAF